jgi:murein L,D-transpeptidase YcbB/YkuD
VKQISIYVIFIPVFLFVNCKNSSVKKNNVNLQNHIELLHFDADKIDIFSHENKLNEMQQVMLKLFYNKKNNAFVWLNDVGMNDYAKSFVALLNREQTNIKENELLHKQKLLKLYNIFLTNTHQFNSTDTSNAEIELLLTINFFDYAKRNWQGLDNNKLTNSGWFITRTNLNEDDRLELFLKNDVLKNQSYVPVYRQYDLLCQQLKKYSDIEQKGGWLTSYSNSKVLKKGDSSSAIVAIKKQLYMLADLTVNDDSNLFNDALELAVKRFQNRFGLFEDGIITGKTFYEMCVPVRDRMLQLLINIERSRWMPVEQNGDYVAVNIPDFKLLVYHNDTLQWSCNVVVGKSKVSSNTIIFNDSIESVVFSPYWNLPASILMKETLPAIRKNSNYLASHNMEIVDGNKKTMAMSSINQSQLGNNFPYNIRQKPGKNNALGLLKFLFPNDYDIYMHDTPEKSLFDEPTRMFSHGCIRLEEPLKLAKFLLRTDKSWTDKKLKESMNGEKETIVKLKHKVPVFIAYFTAWVNRDGQLNFREDLYHHDAKMKVLLF